MFHIKTLDESIFSNGNNADEVCLNYLIIYITQRIGLTFYSALLFAPKVLIYLWISEYILCIKWAVKSNCCLVTLHLCILGLSSSYANTVVMAPTINVVPWCSFKVCLSVSPGKFYRYPLEKNKNSFIFYKEIKHIFCFKLVFKLLFNDFSLSFIFCYLVSFFYFSFFFFCIIVH